MQYASLFPQHDQEDHCNWTFEGVCLPWRGRSAWPTNFFAAGSTFPQLFLTAVAVAVAAVVAVVAAVAVVGVVAAAAAVVAPQFLHILPLANSPPS